MRLFLYLLLSVLGVQGFSVTLKISQQEIIKRIKKYNYFNEEESIIFPEETYQKSPVLIYILDEDASLPYYIKEKDLGEKDQTRYSSDFKKKLMGGKGAIIMQIAEMEKYLPTKDFYFKTSDFKVVKPQGEVFGKFSNYKLSSWLDAFSDNKDLRRNKFKIDGFFDFITHGSFDYQFGGYRVFTGHQVGLKKVVRLSSLGFSINDRIELEVTWGDPQIKEVGRDAFIALNGLLKESPSVYLIQSDFRGLPIAHDLVK